MIYYFDFARHNVLGYDVLTMNITEGDVALAAYKQDNEEGAIHGEDIDVSLAGKLLKKIHESTMSLDDVRSHMRFSDMCCFGLSPTTSLPFWVNTNRETRERRAFPLLLDNGYPVRVLFPDTESTFTDCIFSVPRSFDGEPFYVFSNIADAVNTRSAQDMGVLGGLPVVALTGDDKIAAGGETTLSLALGCGGIDFERLYDITMESDAGYLPKRRYRLATGEDCARVKVCADGLDAGDVITITARISGFGIVLKRKITVTEQEMA